MTLPQFLEKLSKSQITEEVLKLCRLYPEVENYFENKISEINSEQKITKNLFSIPKNHYYEANKSVFL